MPNWNSKLSVRSNLFTILCLTLIGTTFFNYLLYIRHIGTKIQLTEIVFFLLLPFIPVAKVLNYQWKEHKIICLLISFYLLFDVISSVLSKQPGALIESFARCYLFVVFVVLGYFFSTLSTEVMLKRLTQVFLICSVPLFAFAVLGYWQVITTGYSRYIYIAYDYPYFGTLYRLSGPTIYPSMMISIAICLVTYLLGLATKVNFKRLLIPGIVLLLICAILTFSKALLLLALVLIVFLLKWTGLLNRKILITATVIITLFLEVFTHVIFLKNDASLPGKIIPSRYTSGHILFRNNSLVIVETDYLNLKRVELDMFAHRPLFGVGTGNFYKGLPQYIQSGFLPARFGHYDPHSTYLGTLAENGIFATIILIAFTGYLFYLFSKQKLLFHDDFLLALFIGYLCFLIDGISTDILNFRHFWVFMAIAVVYMKKMETSSSFAT